MQDPPTTSRNSPGEGAATERRLADLLVRRGDVQQADLDRVTQIRRSVGGRLSALLVRSGAISEDLLLDRQAELAGAVHLRDPDDLPDGADVHRFLAESPIRFDWFPDNAVLLWRRDRELHCLARDYAEHRILATVTYFYPGEPVRLCVAARHQIDRLLDLVKKEQAIEELYAGSGSARQLWEMAEEAPIIEFVNHLLAQAVDLNASDVHVEPTENQFAVRMRVDGVLHTKLTQPAERFPAVASRIKLISGLDIAERRLPQDGRISTRVSGRDMDVRVSTVPCEFGESVVMRLLASEREHLALERLGMEADHLSLFRSWFRTSNGMLLVSGPTGSGKSTTLAAAMNEIDDGVKKLISVEDPVEHQLPNVTQIQTHADIGYTFARALRAILRQDPDVIMIGEIRDFETAEIAIRAAMTGHLVLSTVHTNDALSSFLRLIDMGVEPFLVAASLRGVQAQRLVRKVCPRCAERVPAPALVRDRLGDLDPGLLGDRWVRATGCSACRNTGYHGRTGIYELVPVSSELQKSVVARAKLPELATLARAQGHRTLLQDGLVKASHGHTTVEEVQRLTLDE